jgi:hypothetical protein
MEEMNKTSSGLFLVQMELSTHFFIRKMELCFPMYDSLLFGNKI